VKFVTTPAFESDFKALSPEEKRLFREAVRTFNDACDRFVESSGGARWPASLRVKRVRGAPGVWEMTWSFSGPDGRATWEWTTVGHDGQDHPAVRWRRVGRHDILTNP
jgi:hypothetical protein